MFTCDKCHVVNQGKCIDNQNLCRQCIRITYFDGDFRRSPKTSTFCCICQRDLNPRHNLQIVFLGVEFCSIIHPDFLDGSEIKAVVGPECLKKIPDIFIKVSRYNTYNQRKVKK